MEYAASTVLLHLGVVGACSVCLPAKQYFCLFIIRHARALIGCFFGLKLTTYKCSTQAFSGNEGQDDDDAHQASIHVWDIRRTSGAIPTLARGRGSVSAASCVAEFQCAGPRAKCLRWHPTNERLLGASSTIVGDSFAQGCIVQVWDTMSGDTSRTTSKTESLGRQRGAAVIPTHCSLASSNTGAGNNFGLWSFDKQ